MESRVANAVMHDVGEAAGELADIADRVGLFGAAKKLRQYGQAIELGANTGDETAKAVLRAKNAYDQSATKRVVTALGVVAAFLNKRKSPLRRVRGKIGKPTVAKARPTETEAKRTEDAT